MDPSRPTSCPFLQQLTSLGTVSPMPGTPPALLRVRPVAGREGFLEEVGWRQALKAVWIG